MTEAATTSPARPTVWGLTPSQVHDRFWAARAVQVVRQGEPSEIVEGAELFLLTDPRSLVVFKLGELVEALSWLTPRVMVVRVTDRSDRGYREFAVSDEEEGFLRFERRYQARDTGLTRVALTPDPELVELWQGAGDARDAWGRLKDAVDRSKREVRRVRGRVFDSTDDLDVDRFMKHMVTTWSRPDSTIPGLRRLADGAWGLDGVWAAGRAEFAGGAWIGAGREVGEHGCVMGPAVLWDRPEDRPSPGSLRWEEIEPTRVLRDPAPAERPGFSATLAGKRLFDILFSLVALALTLPLYPLIALAIVLENGRPVFFVHRREARGGREFGCLKFRSMKQDAERVKEDLGTDNQADGPQFFMKDDPRLTRVGRFIRKTQLDELPQFFNVLLGHMSVVGPRPSPHEENQFCPGWREARLSVRPGVTGLWQVRRTRKPGEDFQEWIRYDLEYVRRMSPWLDLVILWRTLLFMIGLRR